jgi:hypothetical protein
MRSRAVQTNNDFLPREHAITDNDFVCRAIFDGHRHLSFWRSVNSKYANSLINRPGESFCRWMETLRTAISKRHVTPTFHVNVRTTSEACETTKRRTM